MNIHTLITPVNVKVLQKMLVDSKYGEKETDCIVRGFTEGFDIGYDCPHCRRDIARNIPLKVGDKFDLWSKIMKEVKLKRYVGPFNEVPVEHFIQSPIGLVPKAGGDQTRLIFHPSYDFKSGNKSLNHHTQKDKCSVKYNDIDHVVDTSFVWKGTDGVYYGKTDLKSVFRILCLNVASLPWLVMMADHPITGEKKFFADKCLPFGVSISCSHFQQFSNAIKHILEYNINQEVVVTNYLDDFLFTSPSLIGCNYLIRNFLELCEQISIPVAEEKN